MKKTYANQSETLPSQQLKITIKGRMSVLFATVLLISMSLILAPYQLFAQAPTLSYSTPQTFTVGTAVTLSPTSSLVAGYGYSSSAITFASGFNRPMGLATDAAGNVYVADYGNNLVKKIPPGGGTPTTVGSGFTGPTGVAIDPAGNVWVTDSGDLKEVPAGGGAITTTPIGDAVAVAADSHGNVFVLETSGGFGGVTEYPAGGGAPVVISSDDNNQDTGIAVDRLGDIFVSFQAPIPDINQVQEIGSGGGYNNLGAGLNAPTGVAVDGIGNVFVADAGFTGIVEYPVNGAAQLTVSSGLNGPNGVALDGAGNIYESDAGTNTVKEIKAVGGYFISPGLPAGLNLDETTGIISGTPTVASPATNYTITAHNSSGSTSATLNITVNSAPPLSTLANLVLSSGTLAPSFASGTLNYTASVVNAVTSITVTPTTSSPTATVTVNGTTVASGSASASIPLAAGSNTITVVVTAAGGVSTNTYTVDVTRVPPANTALSDITLSTGTLSPAFASATTSYVDSVSYSTSSITLTPTTSDPTSTVTVNGTTVTSGSPSGAISLTPGTNQVTVVVTASDGITTTTYTVFVTSPSVVFSYSSPNTYGIDVPITPLAPTVSGGTVAAPAYSSSFVTLATGFSLPSGVAVDAAGNVYVADQGNNAVKKVPAGGGSPVAIGSGIIDPFCVAVDAAGNVYVGDHSSAGIKKIPAGGGAPVVLGSGLAAPVGGVAVDGAGNVYVGDRGNDAVKEILASGGSPITLTSGFTPYGVAVDAEGNVYVGDYTNSEIKKIPAGGGTPVVIGTGFGQPVGVAVDASGNVYVGGGGAVREIPVTGGSTILLNSSFNGPAGVAVDREGNVYVADEFNNAIEKIKPVGGYYIGPFLPAGLSFSNSTGVISGTPTMSSPATNYFITAYNSSGSGLATTNIKVVSNNANLASLTLSSGTLAPVFAGGTSSYTASVGNAVSSITVTPTTSDPFATVTVDGIAVASGSASAGIPLVVGPNTITTIVTAGDGTTTNTYTVIVTRAPSTNAGLANITLSSGVLSPSFATGTTAYMAPVANTTTFFTVTPTTSDATATVTVNGTAVASGSPSANIPLATGPNTITIIVTAQDGATTDTYTVTVNKVAPTYNSGLLSIRTNPSESTLVSTTGPGYLNYTEAVTNSTTSIQVIPTAQDVNATIKVNGVVVASGTASASIPLAIGANSITTVITSALGGYTKTIILTVDRAGPSSNAEIASITTNPKESSLVGVTGPGYLNYSEAVTNGTTSIEVIATTKDPNATMTVNGTPTTSGTASAPIALAIGPNLITTVVTAQDGVTTKTVTITVSRAGPSSNAEIASIATYPFYRLTGTTGPGYLNYKVSIYSSTPFIQIIPTAKDPNATITVNGSAVTSGDKSPAIALTVGANTINTIVTAQDGTTTKTVVITVNYTAPPDNNTYQQISVTKPADDLSIASDGIIVHEGVSPNGDGINDYLAIDGITSYPNNRLMIVDRNGVMVYQAKGYDNSSKLFDGHASTNGKMQLPGTYFYSLDYTVNGENKHKTGYIILKY